MLPKIAVITHRSDHRGGMERYALDIVYQLAKEGRLAALITKTHPRTATLNRSLPVKSLRLRWLPAKLQPLLLSIYCYWYKKCHPENILLACSKIFCADIMICGSTHWGYLHSQSKKPMWRDRLEIFYEKCAYQQATCVIAHSPQMQQELIEWYGISADKIMILYPPINQHHFSIQPSISNRQQLLQKLNFPEDDRCIFLFPSSGHRRKGLAILLKIFADFEKEALLIIAGKKTANKQSNVISLGYVANMPPLYAACDYTILASTYEPFGLVAIESVLCGTPVLLSNVCGSNAVLSSTVRINFHAEDQIEIKAALEKAINNPFRIDNPTQHINFTTEIHKHLHQVINHFHNMRACDQND